MIHEIVIIFVADALLFMVNMGLCFYLFIQ